MDDLEDNELFGGVSPLDRAEVEVRPAPAETASGRYRAAPKRAELEAMSHKELVDYAELVQRKFRLLDKENEFISWEHQSNLAFFSRVANIAHQLNTVKLDTVVAIAVAEVAEHFKCGAAAFFSYNPGAKCFDLVRASADDAGLADYALKKMLMTKLFVSRDEPYIVDYKPETGCLEFEDGEVIDDDDIPAGWRETFKDRVLVFPLKVQTAADEKPEPLGGLILGDAREGLEGKDAEAALLFADLLSASLHNSRLVAKLNELIVIDPLTRIYNRRHLVSELTREMNQAFRQGHSLSIAMIDIDYFKSFNDMYGHLRGDEVIRGVASTLRDNLRTGVDFVARYGGEEFVVVLPFTGLENSAEVANRLRKKIEDRSLGESRGRFGRMVIGVTCSFGVAEYIKGESLEDFIGRADKAMYAAKQAGKNRVVAAEQEDDGRDRKKLQTKFSS